MPVPETYTSMGCPGFQLSMEASFPGTTPCLDRCPHSCGPAVADLVLTIHQRMLQVFSAKARQLATQADTSSRNTARSFAGLGEWIAGVSPHRVTPFVWECYGRPIGSSGRDGRRIYGQQIALPLNWLHPFAVTRSSLKRIWQP